MLTWGQGHRLWNFYNPVKHLYLVVTLFWRCWRKRWYSSNLSAVTINLSLKKMPKVTSWKTFIQKLTLNDLLYKSLLLLCTPEYAQLEIAFMGDYCIHALIIGVGRGGQGGSPPPVIWERGGQHTLCLPPPPLNNPPIFSFNFYMKQEKSQMYQVEG